jgi:hypothetical protein
MMLALSSRSRPPFTDLRVNDLYAPASEKNLVYNDLFLESDLFFSDQDCTHITGAIISDRPRTSGGAMGSTRTLQKVGPLASTSGPALENASLKNHVHVFLTRWSMPLSTKDKTRRGGPGSISLSEQY